MINLKAQILKLKPVRQFRVCARRTYLPGFQGASVFEISRFFRQNLTNVHLSDRAAAITYNFLTALPPTLLFLFTLIPYLPLQNVQIIILTTLRLMVPDENTYRGISKLINDLMQQEQRSILSFSLLLTLFYSSNGVIGLMRYFDKDHKVYVKRSPVRRRFQAIKLTLVLLGVVIAALVVLFLQTELVNTWIEARYKGQLDVVKALSFPVLGFIIFSAISCIYIYGPSLTHRFKFFSAGAVMAALACIISSAGFFYAVNHFLNYSKVYGSIGTLIGVFVLLSINTRLIMLGYDLNVSILMAGLRRQNAQSVQSISEH